MSWVCAIKERQFVWEKAVLQCNPLLKKVHYTSPPRYDDGKVVIKLLKTRWRVCTHNMMKTQGCAIIEFLILFDLQYSWGLFCNTNINNDICQGCFAIATSITISERGALQYQFQYNIIRCMFCNSNINTNISRGCFAILISVVTLARSVLQYQSQYNNHFLALKHYSNPSGKWN